VGVAMYFGTCPANNTTYDLTIAPSGGTSGWLEVAGTLWLCGNVKLNAPANATPTTFGIFQIDPGGTLNWDMNNGTVAYRLVPGVTGGWNQLILGDTSHPCTSFSTESCPVNVLAINAGSANPILVDVAGTNDSMTYQIYGALIRNCGSSSIGCVNYATDGSTGRNNYAGAGLVDIEQSVFDTTGGFQGGLAGDFWNPVASFTFKENRFLNDLIGSISLAASGGFNAPSSKPCLFTDNYFSAPFSNGNMGFAGCTFTGNEFANSLRWNASQYYPLAAFQGNGFLAEVSDQYVATSATASVVQGNYVFWPTYTGSVHNFDFSYATKESYIGNVFESGASNEGEGHCLIGSTVTPATPRWILLDNLAVPAANGEESCQMMIDVSAGDVNSGVSYADHNGVFGTVGADYAWINGQAHTSLYPANQTVRTVRSNIGYSPSTGNNNLGVGPSAPNAGVLSGIPANVTYAPLETNNVWFHPASSTDWGAGVNSTCNPSTSVGTPYDQCTTGTVPGAGDITADPKLLDGTRGLLAWASRLHGQAASLAGAQAALIGCSNLGWCIGELVAWVQRGYQPTNLALKGKAYDGRIVGFTGTLGSGYTGGSCTAAVTPQDSDDLGYGAVLGCTLVGGVPSIQITNPGMHYRIATSATITITGTCTGGCIAASLTPVIAPLDPGPVQIVVFGRVE
jgi:hypothetical protein